MTELNSNEPRPMLASVENTVNNHTSPHNDNEIPFKPHHSGRPGSRGSIDSHSVTSSNSVSTGSEKHSFPAVQERTTISEPIPFSSPSSSTNGRPSSVVSNLSSNSIMVAASSSHSNLTASLLTPTLASALGIIPSARKRRHAQRQNTTPLPSTTATTAATASSSSAGTSASTCLSPTGAIAGSSSWSRRPSLPSMPSGDSRMSMYSVASFESLPEGESVSHISSSPYTKQHTGDTMEGTVYGSSPRMEYNGGGGIRRNKDHSKKNHVRIDERLNRSPERSSHESDWNKRKNVAMELLDTERAFVASLRIVNDHYYQPLLALSKGLPLSTTKGMKLPSNASPTLSKKAINEIFSNFADILHLNSELLVRLDDRLSGRNRDPPNSRPVSMVEPIDQESQEQLATLSNDSPVKARPWDPRWDLIGDLLAPMAPFLKMYSFYVKNFSSALTRIEAERKASDVFARFLKETERLTWMTNAPADNQNANGASARTVGFGFGLGLQAHLLSVVQRIPRYKLLVGELMKCTPEWHKDFSDLRRAYHVIEQVAESINDNIRQHEMVLSMLNIQRTLIGMNEPLLAPGRSLIKRATLRKAGRKDIHAREFFLFTDCIIYAAPIGGPMADASAAWQVLSRYGVVEGTSSPLNSPTMAKPAAVAQQQNIRSSSPSKAFELPNRRRTISVPTQIESHRLSFSSLEGQQLQFRGKFALQDCTVVGVESNTSTDFSLRFCIEIRTPGKSFAIYADSTEAKNEWLTAIRNAREEWMSNRRTLHAEEDSITAKRERRRSLQAGMVKQVSFPRTSDQSIPEGTSVETFTDQRSRKESLPSFSTTGSLAAYLTGSTSTSNNVTNGSGENGVSDAKSGGLKVLEDYNAPVWVPDSRADKCACCSESFGLWRRKHHCRLCGQVVCWSCSQRSFLIASYEEGEQDRPARACDTCYESVFPEIPEPSLADQESANAHAAAAAAAAALAVQADEALNIATDQEEQDSSFGIGGGGIRNSNALDSDASLPSCPPTPTSPQTMCIITTSDGEEKNVTSFGRENEIAVEINADSNNETQKDSQQALQQQQQQQSSSIRPPLIARRQRSVSPSGMLNDRRKAAIDQTTAPAARIAKAHVADAQVFHGKLLSPQVHAATSGSGTFRLVTPRLTTPEWERPPIIRSAKTVAGGELHTTTNASSSSSSDVNHNKGGDYFSGVHLGNTELNSGGEYFPPAPVRRRKPLSAAARLSSVYGALPLSTPNASSSPSTPASVQPTSQS